MVIKEKRNSLFQKGFIGPIGDDLPSLIPIVVSLLLFFMIFSATLSTYSSKNLEIRKQTDMLSAARIIKGDSIILSIDQFKDRCDTVKMKNYPSSFMFAIYKADYDISTVINDFANETAIDPATNTPEKISENFLKEDDVSYFCGYQKRSGNRLSSATRNYALRFYPIAIQTKVTKMGTSDVYAIIPGIVAMVIWE
jgi:hypothetical protein